MTGRLDFYSFIGAALGLLVGMIGHELAHGWTAVRLGDQSPRFTGRLTLNPKAHVDPFGTLVMPAIFLVTILFNAGIGFIFGYAKPITIRPERLRKPRRDAIAVALAGPAFNLAIIAAAGLLYRSVPPLSNLEAVFFWIARVNAFLLVVNILPIPPLDGSKILAQFISPLAALRMEEYGQYLILFLVVLFLILHGVIDNIARAIYEPICGIPRFIVSG